VAGEHVLTIQTDAVLCSNSPYSINDFLEYDWVGAPWKKWPSLLAGNGGIASLLFFMSSVVCRVCRVLRISQRRLRTGLSLRRKSKLIETIKKCVVDKPRVEDMWYAYCFRQLPHMGRSFSVKLAPQDVSQNFAVETLYSPTPLGAHKPWAWLPYDEARFGPPLAVACYEALIGVHVRVCVCVCFACVCFVCVLCVLCVCCVCVCVLSQLEKLIKFCPELLSVAPEGAIREAQQRSSSSTPAKPSSSNNKHRPSPIIKKKSK
jgi:hypothetical protein